jgi:zinc-ribbon family
LILFGWGKKTKRTFGLVGPYHCVTCGRDSLFRLVRVVNWFTLFFVPVIPYSKEYFLVCPNCSKAIQLSKDNVKEIKSVIPGNLSSES